MGDGLSWPCDRRSAIKARFEALAPLLDERGRRLFAASEARAAGRGGVMAVSRATGIARSTIDRGLAICVRARCMSSVRVRRQGGGGKSATRPSLGLLAALNELVQSSIRGDPEAALLWVSKSQRHLAAALARERLHRGQKLVGRLLRRLGFSLQANSKTREGASHPDRNAQFEHINAEVPAFQAAGEPAISVDTKKKELVGDFKNGGRELRPQGQPEPVRVHDFRHPRTRQGRAIRRLRHRRQYRMGQSRHQPRHRSVRRREHPALVARTAARPAIPPPTRLLITADCGGSNGARVRLWKRELQVLADELGMSITVCHLPPGTSSKVDDWRGGSQVRGYRTWLRFQSPLVKPDMQISRIRLSPASSSLRARQVGTATRQGVKAERLVEILVRILADTRCLLVRCVAPTIVEAAVAHTSAQLCRSEGPALG